MKDISRKGFTLIELLIVIAIILILIAIALPNFLEAQVRARVAKVKGDMRTLATAIESYYTVYNTYPGDQDNDPYHPTERGLYSLTTPMELLTELPYDLFSPPMPEGANLSNIAPHYTLDSGADNRIGMRAQTYFLTSIGPDVDDDLGGAHESFPYACEIIATYNPTNGTKSNGDMVRFGGAYRSGTNGKVPYNYFINGFHNADYQFMGDSYP